VSFFEELKRRNVVKVAVLYIIASWLVLQVTDVLASLLPVPEWTGSLVFILLVAGFLPVMIFSWVYELTPEGLKRERKVDRSQSITHQTGRKINVLIVVLLTLAIGVVAVDRLYPARERSLESESTQNLEKPASEKSSELAARKFAATPVIAVLPFKAAGSDDGGFLAGGLHDDLLTRLAKLNAFKVISRTSMMEYADTTKNMRQIGDELGAGYILEGGVQARGTRVRINAQLIDAEADQHIWAETYDKELTANNLFDVQAELAAAIARALETQLSAAELALVRDVPTENMAAYNAYLRGLRTYNTTGYVGTPQDRDAVAAFEEAVRLDPNFALAWAGLATARIRADCCDYEPEQSAAALEALDSARALQPGMLESELAWAEYLYRVRNEYGLALETLEPLRDQVAGNAYALQLIAWLNRRLGHYDVAFRTLQAAQRLQPRSPSIYLSLIMYAWLVDDCGAAGVYVGQLLSLNPEARGSRVREAEFELECNGNAKRVVGLMRNMDFSEDQGGIRAAITAGWHARDTEFLVSLFDTEYVGSDHQVPIWQQLELASVYIRLQPNEDLAVHALDKAAKLLDEYGADEELAQRAVFALMTAHYYSLMGNTDETRRWIEEHKQRYRRDFKGDVAEEANNRFDYAWIYACAGMQDEAIEELRIMLEQAGGHRFPYVDGPPLSDILGDNPAYIELRERFGNRKE
jgi:TolB-like protein